ncbi:MerR family transcriptional regulator [Marinobacter similis]|uniref:hypothetical protein n=1 Tax=Marinobacter similis TaxID=1420916 RepID=UPI0011DD6A83|nr:hypothetical protein [Marinobacter similis]
MSRRFVFANAPRVDAGDMRQRALAKLNDVDQKIGQLRQIRQGLEALVDRCPGQGAGYSTNLMNKTE